MLLLSLFLAIDVAKCFTKQNQEYLSQVQQHAHVNVVVLYISKDRKTVAIRGAG